MSDLIDREHVIDFLKLTRDSEYKKSMSAECKHKSVIRSKHDAHVAFCDYLIEYVKQVPSAQLEVVPHKNYRYLSDYWCECGCHLGKQHDVKYCPDCGKKVKWDE